VHRNLLICKEAENHTFRIPSVKSPEDRAFYDSIKIDGFVKSRFMPQAAAYEVRRGAEPDTLFQTLSKHFGGDGRRFGVQHIFIEARGVWEA